MEIKKYENGLRLVVNTTKNKDIVSFKIFVKAGSMDEDVNNLGIAHFLEHMFFKSTKNYTAKELLTRFDFLGANQNAYTSNTKTCYYFQSLSENVKKCVELYSEMFFNRHYNKEEIENEKNVIVEELKRDEDMPVSKCIRQAVNSMFNNTPYAHDILGTEKSIRQISSHKLTDFKNKFYTPKNIVISVSGNITMSKISKIVDINFCIFLNSIIRGTIGCSLMIRFKLSSFVECFLFPLSDNFNVSNNKEATCFGDLKLTLLSPIYSLVLSKISFNFKPYSLESAISCSLSILKPATSIS